MANESNPNDRVFNAINLPEFSEWQCHLFGSTAGNGITLRPLKGKEPNCFWRLMQFLVFGNRWVRDANN